MERLAGTEPSHLHGPRATFFRSPGISLNFGSVELAAQRDLALELSRVSALTAMIFLRGMRTVQIAKQPAPYCVEVTARDTSA